MQKSGGGGRVEGLFDDRRRLTQAVRRLAERSVPADTIQVFILDEAGNPTREIRVEDEAGALKGAIIGGSVGAAVGVLIVIVFAVASFNPEDAGLFGLEGLASGIWAIALLTVAGAPFGALLGLGHWPGRKRMSRGEIDEGQGLVVVQSRTLAAVAREVLEEAGATRVTVTTSG